MTEVAAGTPTTGVAPRAVLGGHPDDEPADRVHDPWAARSATAAAVVCPRDQLSMPAEEGIGRDQGVPVTASPSPEARGLCGPAPALGVGEPETARTERLSEDAMLFLESVNDVTRLLVDPARDGHDEELQHVGKRRQTGRASQRLSAVTNVATRRASSVESARRTASIGFLDSTPAVGARGAIPSKSRTQGARGTNPRRRVGRDLGVALGASPGLDHCRPSFADLSPGSTHCRRRCYRPVQTGEAMRPASPDVAQTPQSFQRRLVDLVAT